MTTAASMTDRGRGLATLAIAMGAGLASLSMNFWMPFLPLYMIKLGASSDANALFWIGIATTGQGVARLVSAPVWGVLSDRLGRKLMFVRALYFATATTLIAAFATAPWHVAVAFACQGLFSGFIPAAVALTSVTVPDDQLSKSLGTVTGAQYLGNTIGPGIGAALALIFGLRGSIFVGSMLPALAATAVLFVVPRDRVEQVARVPAGSKIADTGRPGSVLSGQFFLAILLYFFLFAVTQLVRLSTPISLTNISGHENQGIVGIAFTLGGIGSMIGVLVIARHWVTEGSFARKLAIVSVLAGGLHLLLALSPNVSVYVLWFTLISLAEATMLPATNTLIAANVPKARRGTAFGIAGSAQALALMVGPMSAALFASLSLTFGYVLLAVLFVAFGVLVRWRLREPGLDEPAKLPNATASMQKGSLIARP